MSLKKIFGKTGSNNIRNIAKIMAGVTAASAIMGFGMHQVYGKTEVTLQDILGNLYPYGVVAGELTISADFESNFAANVLYVSGHSTGNAVGTMTNEGGIMYAGKIKSASAQWSDEEWAQYGELKLRSGNYLITGEKFTRLNNGETQIDNNYYKWVNSDGKIMVNDEISRQLEIVENVNYLNIDKEKKNVLSILNSFEVKAGKNQFENGVIDVTEYEEGVVTVNYDITNGVNNNLTIKKNSNQLLIINAVSNNNSETDTNTVAKYLLSVDGKAAEATLDNMESLKVIWNFDIYKGNLIVGDNGGVIVAPYAKVSNCGTSSGYLIAGTFNNTGGEWHYWNKQLEKETTTEQQTTTTEAATTTIETTTTTTEAATTTETATTTTEAATTTEAETTTPDEVITITDEIPLGKETTTPKEEETTDPVQEETTTEEIADIDNDIPLGKETTAAGDEPENNPDDELIQLDDMIPLGAPQTGDNNMIFVYVAMAALALGGSIASVVLNRKKEEK